VENAGATVIVVPPSEQVDNSLAQICSLANGILLPGGYDVDPASFNEESVPANGRVDPEVDALDLFLAHYALSENLPVLGICRGCQVLNVAAGGGLYQDLASQWGKPGLLQHNQRAPRWHGTHQITVEPGSLLASILGETYLRVNSFHHQAVRSTGPNTQVVARTADGVVEAIEIAKHSFALGVQWHPEGMIERHLEQQNLFSAFVQASRI
jgi:putative glutamine amidotransferase